MRRKNLRHIRLFSLVNDELTEVRFCLPDECSFKEEKTILQKINDRLIEIEELCGKKNITQTYMIQRWKETENNLKDITREIRRDFKRAEEAQD